MTEKIVECMRTYMGTHTVVAGTRAVVEQGLVGATSLARLRITETKQGTELHVGETYDVPKADLDSFWAPFSS